MRRAATVPGVVAWFLLAAAAVPAGAQALSVSEVSIDLPSPDAHAYESGRSVERAFVVTVSGCPAGAGCRLSLENPFAASGTPLEIEWRLLSVGGSTPEIRCESLAPLRTWMPLNPAPVDLVEMPPTPVEVEGCMVTLEARAVGLEWGVHEFPGAATSYWRELVFRAAPR